VILSQFQLNLDNPEARRDLGNRYEMHRTLKKLVSGGQVLWRLEGRAVLLLSDSSPDWSQTSAGYLAGQPRTKTYPVEELKLSDRKLRFRLQANATKSIKEGVQRNERGKRVQLVTEQDQLAWLARQAERCGFKIVQATTTESQDLRFRKKPGQKPITLGSCVFEGSLEVNDESRFKDTLKTGLGRAKAFGLGLLSIAPG
jgi:CRISPR system Cascade subunit CasE